MEGYLHSVQTLGTLDGPGVRFVAFFQGCPLRCGYCHNPDTWPREGGQMVTAPALLRQIERFRPYFGTRGGLTCSGGEPLWQAEFLCELLKLCKEKELHTAIDTSGMVHTPQAHRALELCDLVLLDIKFATEADYAAHIPGGTLAGALETLSLLQALQKPVWIRQVVTPGVNDRPEDLRALATLLRPYSCIQRVELLPFCKLCLEKYQALGLPFPFERFPAADPAHTARLQARLCEQLGIPLA